MLVKYFKAKELVLMAIAVGLIAIQVFLDLKIPEYMSNITAIITSYGTIEMVLKEGWGMLACAFGSLLTAVIVAFITTYVAAMLSQRLREKEFDRVETFSMQDLHKFSTASLITRSTNDVTQVQMAFAIGFPVIVRAPILAGWAILKISDKNWQWTTATMVAILALVAIIGVLLMLVIPHFKKIQWLTDDVNRITRENLTGVRVIRAFNAEAYQEKKFNSSNDSLTSANLRVNRLLAVMMPSITVVLNILSLLIYWLGAYIISSATDSATQLLLFSDMVVFLSYAMQLVMAFIILVIILMMLPRAWVAAKRIEEVINTTTSIVDGNVTESLNGATGTISLRNVSFKYPNASDFVLKGIDLDIKKGETIAIIGSTGSGKTTLINLIPRLYDVTEGQILVNGIDVRNYTHEALHKKFGYVPQKAVLSSGTISYNVNYGDQSRYGTPESVARAVTLAQGAEFVESMDGKYESVVSQNGVNLSGGQKQRLSIARAVHRMPEFFIFDDSFSALDYKTDRKLRDALKKETAGTTTLIVAQRISTIMDADKIVVLNEGHIAGIGRHDELIDKCQVYREIATSQLPKEELRK